MNFEHRTIRAGNAHGDRSLHRVASPGSRVQDGRAQDPRPAKKSERCTRRKFHVRAFHDAVLDNGGVPLPVLEHQIDEYIAATRTQ
jgi:hypothetical protein